MLESATSPQLFRSPAVIHFVPKKNRCRTCHEALNVQKTLPGKRAATLAIGDFLAHETVYYCPKCREVFYSHELRALIPEHGNFGYDIMVCIGKLLFLECRGYQQIRLELQRKNIRISKSGGFQESCRVHEFSHATRTRALRSVGRSSIRSG